MNEDIPLDEFISVGIVQTTIDSDLAWHSLTEPRISHDQDDHVWQEIIRALRAFEDGKSMPKIIVFPELSLPRTRIEDFEKLICRLNVLAITGVDYKLDRSKKVAKNEGVFFIPKGFWDDYPSKYCTRVRFGKSFGAPNELKSLNKLSWKFDGDPNVYIFEAWNYGRIGVSICYDFMDIQRALMYRGRIHHLFIITYNQDLKTFQSLADSLSRIVFCNVVICNTGIYGGSIAMSPYKEANKRTIYLHGGNNLFSTQVIQLPIKGLQAALLGNTTCSDKDRLFKDPPPGIFD